MPPLDGIRVLDLTRLLPGAYATQLLADRGAEVIKIEDPRGGDTMRTIGARWFDAVNRGKKSVTLDLRSPQSAPTLDALLVTADVLIDSFRPSTAKRLRVDPETVRAKHPHVICASLIGFPRDSPKAEQPAHDINYQSLAGLLTAMPGPLVADIGGAMQMTIAILAALVERQRTGVGCAIDVALGEAARQWATFPSTGDFAGACYTMYETTDGEWLALGALEGKFWRAFCERLGRPDLAPLQHARDFDEIKAVMRTKTQAEWLKLFDGVDACLTPVRSAKASRSSDLTEREASAERTAPALGADTEAIVADLRRRGLL
jgi:crotonobetainyl-CoA:carnitine CoA-transferase CaiB-like acyl-CoA transferase